MGIFPPLIVDFLGSGACEASDMLLMPSNVVIILIADDLMPVGNVVPEILVSCMAHVIGDA